MSYEPKPTRDPALQPADAPRDGAALPAARPDLDANGFDPADYKWIPVARRERADGWTADKQRAFIEALADSCSVTEAADAVHMSPGGAYKLRRSPGGERFAAAWDAAVRQGAARLADALTQRAIHGVEEPVFYKGERVGARIRYNDRLGMFLLRAHQPERYDADRRATPAASDAAATVAGALESLTPVTPEQPHLLLPPDELNEELLLAKMGTGELPCWHDPVIGGRFRQERRSTLEDARRRYGGEPPKAFSDDPDGAH